jgi:dolichol-phosphate mannosyltransferase
VSSGVSIVIPCHDEAENVGPLAAELRRALEGVAGGDYEVVFVDDGSKDATAERVRAEVERGPPGRFRLLRLAENGGESAATEAGLRAARGRLVVTMDGDLQNDPADIPALLAPILAGDADCVCGWRRERRDGDSGSRRLQSRIANGFRAFATGDPIRDAGCTFRAFRRECVERVKVFRGMHRFLPTLIRWEGYRVVEIPVRNRPRVHGRSKYGMWGRAVAGLHDVFAVRWMRSRIVRWRVVEDVRTAT